jgi:hypothetical protein
MWSCSTYLDDTVDTRSEEGGGSTGDTDRFLTVSLHYYALDIPGTYEDVGSVVVNGAKSVSRRFDTCGKR